MSCSYNLTNLTLVNDADISLSTLVSDGDNTEDHDESSAQDDAIPANIQQSSHNWFARFFHIKPASKLIALDVSKPRARKEVIKILREWKQYGLEDICLDKKRNSVHAKVGHLNCKPTAQFIT